MSDLPASQYIEARGDGYRVAGTRISLDSIAYAVRRGETVGDILADFPAIQSRQKLEGVIAFVQSHPREVEERSGSNDCDHARRVLPGRAHRRAAEQHAPERRQGAATRGNPRGTRRDARRFRRPAGPEWRRIIPRRWRGL